MANSLIEQFKTYVKFKDLSERAGQVFTTVESYNAFMTQMQNSYQQGYELSDFEFALTLLESIQEENSATITTKKVDDKLQIKANVVPEEDETSPDTSSLQRAKGKGKTKGKNTQHTNQNIQGEGEEVEDNSDKSATISYEDLVARAEKVFPTTQSYNDFVAQLDIAVESGQPLSSFDFALTTFETLKASENSPHYQDELARISQDPQFASFATIAEHLNVTYAQPLFTATKEISQALNDNATLGVETTIVDTTTSTTGKEDILSKVRPTNKVVLQVDDNGLVSNPEALISGDGMIRQANVTTSKMEKAKMDALKGKVDSAGSETEATAIVDSYNSALTSGSVNPVDVSETAGTDMTKDAPLTKEVQALGGVDLGTSADINDQLSGVSAAYEDAIKKLNLEAVEAVAPEFTPEA